jgi:hypothetical protein
MTSTTMGGLIAALKAKVDAVTATGSGSPEDLAMIATAVEKIAGRITALELEAIGETERQAITDLAFSERTTVANALTAALANANTAADALVAAVNADMTAAEHTLGGLTDTALADLSQSQHDAVAAITAERTAAVDAITDAAAEAKHAVSGLTPETFFFNQS